MRFIVFFSAWLTACQVLYTVGIGSAFVGLLLVYLFVCSEKFKGKSVGLNTLITFVLAVACE